MLLWLQEDILAVGAQKALVNHGLSMPVIGCNNSIFGPMLYTGSYQFG